MSRRVDDRYPLGYHITIRDRLDPHLVHHFRDVFGGVVVGGVEIVGVVHLFGMDENAGVAEHVGVLAVVPVHVCQYHQVYFFGRKVSAFEGLPKETAPGCRARVDDDVLTFELQQRD
jgi:hypothetical protein